MNAALEFVGASPEFVLEAIRDSHRHQCALDHEADPTAELTFGTTVAAWRDACDLVRTDLLGAALNEIWSVSLPAERWRAVLEPADRRTLRDVCTLIAANAKRVHIRQAGALGASCAKARAFLAVRALLLRAGANGAELRPLASVDDVARRFPEVFLGPISRLAPGRLPVARIRTPFMGAALGVTLAATVAAVALAWVAPSVAVWCALLAAVGSPLIWMASRIPPREVRFGAIVTFRDLAKVIAGTA